MGGKHWSDLPLHNTHVWGPDGHCVGCMMHMEWPGARAKCTIRAKAPKQPRQALKPRRKVTPPDSDI